MALDDNAVYVGIAGVRGCQHGRQGGCIEAGSIAWCDFYRLPGLAASAAETAACCDTDCNKVKKTQKFHNPPVTVSHLEYL